MSKKLRISESQFRILLENDNLALIEKIKSLIESGQSDNIELAFQLGEGAESYIPDFNMGGYINVEYGSLLRMVLGYRPFGSVGDWKLEEYYDAVIEGFVALYGDGETLDLNGMSIKQLPDSIGTFTHVKNLILGDNHLKNLNENIGNLTKLEILDVSFNELDSLPTFTNNKHNIKELSIRENRFKQFPEAITEMSNLQFLDISFNHITMFPTTIGKLKDTLKILKMDGLNITHYELDVLEHLLPTTDIDHNDI